MAGNTDPKAKAAKPEMVEAIFVRSHPPTFRRAGFEFNSKGYGLRLSDLSDEQLTAIMSEPMLSAQLGEIPASEADDALLSAQADTQSE